MNGAFLSLCCYSAVTVTVQLAACEPTEAVMTAVPADTPVTTPAELTLATLALELRHVTERQVYAVSGVLLCDFPAVINVKCQFHVVILLVLYK